MFLPLTVREREFLERLNAKGEILPEVLTDDERLREIIRTHPGLLWKALNVQKLRGTSHARHIVPLPPRGAGDANP